MKALPFVAKGIRWDVDIDDIANQLDEMPIEEVAETLHAMFQNLPAKYLSDFMGLPNDIEVPAEIADKGDDAITDYISECSGFCFSGMEGWVDNNQKEDIREY